MTIANAASSDGAHLTMRSLVPTLIVPGAPKAGTSTLFSYLAQHPDIDAALIKEPHVYSRSERYARRWDPSAAHSFAQLFDARSASRYRCEASTTYMLSPEAPSRIADDSPDAKFIFVLRNPVDRIVSHYNWLRTFHIPLQTFRSELEADRGVAFDPDCHLQGNYKHYFASSSYGTHLTRYLAHFPAHNVFVITFEALTERPFETVNACFAFLGLSSLDKLTPEHSNKTLAAQLDKRPAALQRLMQATPKHIFRWARAVPGLDPLYRRLCYRRLPPYAPSPAERNWLAAELQEEVAILRGAVGQEFSEWRDFAA